MRGKKPKEREKYIIRLDNEMLVEVTREVYLEWYRSERRERYQRERDRKYRLCSLEELQDRGGSYKSSAHVGDETQNAALRNVGREELLDALRMLPEQDIRLIVLLYFDEMTVKDVALAFGCSRKSIVKWRERILKELRKKIEC